MKIHQGLLFFMGIYKYSLIPIVMLNLIQHLFKEFILGHETLNHVQGDVLIK